MWFNGNQHERHSVEGYNSRNGYYERTLKTQFGEIVVCISRDRNSEFSNHTIPYLLTVLNMAI